jgi:hypothetical protein
MVLRAGVSELDGCVGVEGEICHRVDEVFIGASRAAFREATVLGQSHTAYEIICTGTAIVWQQNRQAHGFAKCITHRKSRYTTLYIHGGWM